MFASGHGHPCPGRQEHPPIAGGDGAVPGSAGIGGRCRPLLCERIGKRVGEPNGQRARQVGQGDEGPDCRAVLK